LEKKDAIGNSLFLKMFFFSLSLHSKKTQRRTKNEENREREKREKRKRSSARSFSPSVKMAGIPLELLDDLCTRFLLNVPAHELE